MSGLRPPDSAPNIRRFRVRTTDYPLLTLQDTCGFLRPIVVRPRPTVASSQCTHDALASLDDELTVDFVLGTPELAALRGRMMKIAAEAGLVDVHNDSVHLLMNALEVLHNPFTDVRLTLSLATLEGFG